jgi:hypothetical protein
LLNPPPSAIMDVEVAVINLVLSFIVDHHLACAGAGLTALLTLLWLIKPRRHEPSVVAEITAWRKYYDDWP